MVPLRTSPFSPMRAFFFGPGLPRGLGAPFSSSCDAVRFKPGFGPGTPFRFAPFVGGASRLLDVAAGVEAALESEAWTAGEGSLMGSDGVETEGAIESDGNWLKTDDGRANLTIFDFAGLAENLEVMAAAAGGMVVLVADMVVRMR